MRAAEILPSSTRTAPSCGMPLSVAIKSACFARTTCAFCSLSQVMMQVYSWGTSQALHFPFACALPLVRFSSEVVLCRFCKCHVPQALVWMGSSLKAWWQAVITAILCIFLSGQLMRYVLHPRQVMLFRLRQPFTAPAFVILWRNQTNVNVLCSGGVILALLSYSCNVCAN